MTNIIGLGYFYPNPFLRGMILMSKQKGENPIYIIPENARMIKVTEKDYDILNGTTPFQHKILEVEKRYSIEQLAPSNLNFIKSLNINYVYSNPNINNEDFGLVDISTDDCAICALANIFDITWGEAFKMLSDIAGSYGLPVSHANVINKVLCNNGYEKIYYAKFDPYYPYYHFKLIDLLIDPEWQIGKYFINIDFPTPHSTVVKNGKLFDIFKYPHLDYQYPFVLFGRVTAVYTEISNAKEFYDYNKMENNDVKK